MLEGNEETNIAAYRWKVRLAARMFGEDAVAAKAVLGFDGGASSYLAAIPLGSNIVGFGYGLKWTAAGVSAMEAVRVYVRTKLPKQALMESDRIPEEIDGIPTDVIAVGQITAAFPRPVPGGVSGGHRDTDGGTLGCLVDQNGSGRFILSNNHVMAKVNTAAIGDPILEPERILGGAANPAIARLSAFNELFLDGRRNMIDAAIAELIDPSAMTESIAVIGRVNPPAIAPFVGMSVQKHGGATFHRIGAVDDVAADVRVLYRGIGFADFERQIAVVGTQSAFAEEGDSGSLVVDMATTRPVGLIFAVTTPRTFCNYASTVLSAFNASVL